MYPNRIIQSICILLVLLLTLGGCADYHHMTDAKQKFAETEQVRMKEQTAVVLKALELIMGGFEKAVVQTNEPKPIFSRTTTVNGQPVTDTVYDSSSTWANVMIQMKRADIIKDLMPMIQEIYKQQQLQIDKPVTASDVAMKFMENIPFMATVAGMYGLGVEGIKNAKANITSTMGDNGTLNNGSGNTTTPSQANGNTTITEAPATETTTPAE